MEINSTFYTIKCVRQAIPQSVNRILERVEHCNVKNYMQDLFSRESAKVNKVSDSVSSTKLTPDSMSIRYSEYGVDKKISAYVYTDIDNDFNIVVENRSVYSTMSSRVLYIESMDEIENVIIRAVEIETKKLQTRGINSISVEGNKDKRSISIKYTDEANINMVVTYKVTEDKMK